MSATAQTDATENAATVCPVIETRDRDTLIRDHVDMARRLARKAARRLPASVRCDELESAALLGLTEAATRFDAGRGEPFVAFAAKRVRGAILDELRRNDVLTRRGRERARQLQSAMRTVEERTGEAADVEAIAEQAGWSVEEVEQARSGLQAAAVVSLEDVRELAAPAIEESAEARLERRQQTEALVAALAELPERDLMILNMYFQDDLTLKEIGDILGVSESRVCQLRSRALKKLRDRIRM